MSSVGIIIAHYHKFAFAVTPAVGEVNIEPKHTKKNYYLQGSTKRWALGCEKFVPGPPFRATVYTATLIAVATTDWVARQDR